MRLLLILLAGALLAQDAPAPPKLVTSPPAMERLTPAESRDFALLSAQWELATRKVCERVSLKFDDCDVRPDQGIVMRRIAPPVQPTEAAKPKPEPKKEGK